MIHLYSRWLGSIHCGSYIIVQGETKHYPSMVIKMVKSDLKLSFEHKYYIKYYKRFVAYRDNT